MVPKAMWRQARSVPGISRSHQEHRGNGKGPSMSFIATGPSSLVPVRGYRKVSYYITPAVPQVAPHPFMASKCIYHEDTAWCPVPDPICISRLPGSSLDGN